MSQENPTLSEISPGPEWVRLLTPRWFAPSLLDITAERLHSMGIQGIMLDLDNTLTEYYSDEIAPTVAAWIAHIHDAGIKTCVVSNTNRVKRLQSLCEPHGVDFVRGVNKPRRKGFRLALTRMGTPLEHTAIIGDQIFTDMLGGNRMGLYTILVPPLSRREFVMTRWFSRNLERALFSYLDRQRQLPSRNPEEE